MVDVPGAEAVPVIRPAQLHDPLPDVRVHAVATVVRGEGGAAPLCVGIPGLNHSSAAANHRDAIAEIGALGDVAVILLLSSQLLL